MNHLSFIYERAAYGSLAGVYPLNLVGVNAATTTTYRTLWDLGATSYAFQTTAISTPFVSSGSANDAAAGTGARTVRLWGVTTSYATFTEDKTLNGQTAVNLTTANVLGINRMEVLTAGSGGTNAGIIYCGSGGPASGVPTTTEALIAAGVGVTTSMKYTVPANYTLLVNNVNISQVASTTAGCADIVFEYITNLGPKLRTGFVTAVLSGGSNINKVWTPPLMFPEKTQLQVFLKASAVTSHLGTLDGLLIQNHTANTAQAIF